MDFDSFTIVLLIRRDDAPEFDEAEAAALQDAHMAFLADLHDSGHLLAAGPVSDPSPEIRGVSIMNVGPEEALALKSADPAVKAGIYRLVVLPWMTPGGAVHFTHTVMPRSIADVVGQ
jgi:uncharacterized protein